MCNFCVYMKKSLQIDMYFCTNNNEFHICIMYIIVLLQILLLFAVCFMWCKIVLRSVGCIDVVQNPHC